MEEEDKRWMFSHICKNLDLNIFISLSISPPSSFPTSLPDTEMNIDLNASPDKKGAKLILSL